MIIRKGGHIRKKSTFLYKGKTLHIVNTFTYLGIVFSCGGSLNTTFDTLAGQATKALFTLKSYIVRFPGLTVNHVLDLFDKLILPILN